jgi:hypothetical protein
MYFRLTSISLLIAYFSGAKWMRHVVVANSIVGFVYMFLEMDTLRTVGSRGPSTYMGYGPVKLSCLQNIILNIALHILVPVTLLASLQPPFPHVVREAKRVLAFLIMALVLIDIKNVYPMSSESRIPFYVGAHVFIVVLSLCVFRVEGG